jgi:phosphoserine aminotransferase
MLWDFMDSSDGFYKSKITDKNYRSRVNVIFRIHDGNIKLEETFIEQAKNCGITQIKAHTFNPGIRISMYNAMPVAGVSHLVNFMRCFMVDFPYIRVREDPKM